MKKLIILSFYLVPTFSFGAAPQKATTVCATCHGEKGISASPLWPNLAGQKKDYLVKQLKDFKAGNRKDPLMSPQAASLSDQEVDELAKYFSELKAK